MEILNEPMTPAEFGQAITRAVAAGVNPFFPGAVTSAWIDILGPVVWETGLRGGGVDYLPYFEAFLQGCEVEDDVIAAAWGFYTQLSPQEPEIDQVGASEGGPHTPAGETEIWRRYHPLFREAAGQ